LKPDSTKNVFASHGARQQTFLPLFDQRPSVFLSESVFPPIFSKLRSGIFFGSDQRALDEILSRHMNPSLTTDIPATEEISAGKIPILTTRTPIIPKFRLRGLPNYSSIIFRRAGWFWVHHLSLW
jgi:hypothetical protein